MQLVLQWKYVNFFILSTLYHFMVLETEINIDKS